MSQSREKTAKALEMALYRITKGRAKIVNKKRKLSIASVAEEAGLSTSTIHNNHPDMAEKIRALMNKEARAQRDEKLADLKKEKAKNRELRKEVMSLNEQLAKIASINARLEMENAELQAIVNSDNVTVLRKK